MHSVNRGKRFLVLLVVLILALAITGCGAKTYSLDEEALAKSLISNVNFDCTLYEVNKERIKNFVDVGEAENQYMFMGNGTYSDSFGIFSLTDQESAKKALETVNSYLTDLCESFRDYLPQEASKIENAVVEQRGKYVVFCISPDTETAGKIIEEAFVETDEKVDDESSTDEQDNSGDNDQQEPSVSNTEVPNGGDKVEYPVIESKGKFKDFGNVVAIGDAAYELYSYLENPAQKYSGYINKAANALNGTSNVYDIVVPLSSGITLPDDYYGKISSSNQRTAMDNIFSLLNDKVKTVDIYENLMEHRDEYIFFRTDHHWTQLGAYYGYEVFCKEKGVLPIDLERRKTAEFEGFLGSFYNDTKKYKALEKHPDTLKVYYPISNDTLLKYTTASGAESKWDIIKDVSGYPASIKYSAFIAGDNPYTFIKNNDLSDGSSCVVVKESFGNAFVPFLVDHYEKVYVIDYRYWEGNVIDLAKDKKADDVIFINNLSMIRSDYLTGKLGQIVE